MKRFHSNMAFLATAIILSGVSNARADCPSCRWEQRDTEGHHAAIAGDLAAARDRFEQALALSESFLAGDHRQIESLRDLAMVHEKAGEHDLAIAYERRALSAIEDGAERLRFAALGAHERLAEALQAGDQTAESAGHRVQSIELRKSLYGANDPQIAFDLLSLAQAYQQLDRLDQAIESAEAAVTIRQTNPEAAGDNRLLEGAALDALTSLYVAAGRDSDAAQTLAQMVEIDEAYLGPDHAFLAGTMERLVKVLRRLGRDDEADPLEFRAMDIRARTEHQTPDIVRVANDQ